ncbi:DNA replication/repair protein RecF [Sphingomonas baiyangensis]|uniref:DNA replication and repair protein RecF n=1 Tax=Sphingomonas baiyangensis TaxID=2572576 RepID=A0A4U1L441_9SPHN|nr:DNA replication/repair protein RecF [Sphingomonas baiyangensis]TKD51512.1 DNA replication/repair protein RecF [Sphingomonas baiyangensis]
MLTRLSLSDFRNHRDAVLHPGPAFVVLTGANGAGKTNILEAVSLLAPGRGLRRARFGAMARQGGGGGFGVAATLGSGDAIGTGTQPEAPERRVVRINGGAASLASLAERLSVLWLTPAMDRLFVEPPGERRRFLDRLVLALAPSHAAHAARYEAAMRERNALLAGDARPDADWLAALEARMAEHGAALDAARRHAVALLDAHLGDRAPGAFPRAALAIDGWQGDGAMLAAALREARARDAAAGRALVGPHRADLLVHDRDQRQAAAQCSTGEQKALLLGMVLAHAGIVAARTGTPPVLLLDEVAAHLDPARRAALFAQLAGRGQVWMTGTEPALFDAVGSDATHMVVGQGAVLSGGEAAPA